MDWNQYLSFLRSKRKAILAGLLEKTQQKWPNTSSLTLITKDSYIASELQKNIPNIIQELQEFAGKNISVKINQIDHAGKDLASTTPLGSFITNYDRVVENANLDKKLTFEVYATSISNMIAHAAAKKISKEPGVVYNPLFLYGSTGVGKTHLSEAIAIEYLKNNPSAKVKYITSEEFVNMVIDSIRNSTISNLRKIYRNLDMLIIDDIQFLASKNSCQEELFHLFNTVIKSGKQIIITSDTQPSELKGFAERLTSRFSQGLIIKIDEPDFELRYAILQIKCKDIGLSLAPEKISEIAEKITNTREMIGVLHSYHAHILLTNTASSSQINPTYPNLEIPNAPLQNNKTLNQNTILKLTCLHFGVKPSDLKSDSRSSNTNLARQVCMYILKEYTTKTLVDIALYLNKKDHTTIMHGINKVKKNIISNPSFGEQINRLVNEIRRG